MRLHLNSVPVLDCIESSEKEISEGKLPYKGSLLAKVNSKTKSGKYLLLDEVVSYWSMTKLSEGKFDIEVDVTAWAVNGNSGLTLKVVGATKAKG